MKKSITKLSLSWIKWPLALPLYVLLTIIAACGDSTDEPPLPEPEPEIPAIEISVTSPAQITVERRQNSDVNLVFSGSGYDEIEWSCASSNPEVATVERKDDNALTIKGVSAGEATVTVDVKATDALASNQAKATAKIKVIVERGTVKILAIGNSFSQDAVEQYLYDLAKASGIDVIIGNMYIGGCDLDKHYSNLQSDAGAYEYRKVVNGEKKNHTGTRLSEALSDEAWDYVSLQQASGKSGIYESYAVLPQLISALSEIVP